MGIVATANVSACLTAALRTMISAGRDEETAANRTKKHDHARHHGATHGGSQDSLETAQIPFAASRRLAAFRSVVGTAARRGIDAYQAVRMTLSGQSVLAPG